MSGSTEPENQINRVPKEDFDTNMTVSGESTSHMVAALCRQDLHDAIVTLCKNGVSFHSNLQVMGVLCITVDNQADDIVIKINNKWRKNDHAASLKEIGEPEDDSPVSIVSPAPASPGVTENHHELRDNVKQPEEYVPDHGVTKHPNELGDNVATPLERCASDRGVTKHPNELDDNVTTKPERYTSDCGVTKYPNELDDNVTTKPERRVSDHSVTKPFKELGDNVTTQLERCASDRSVTKHPNELDDNITNPERRVTKEVGDNVATPSDHSVSKHQLGNNVTPKHERRVSDRDVNEHPDALSCSLLTQSEEPCEPVLESSLATETSLLQTTGKLDVQQVKHSLVKRQIVMEQPGDTDAIPQLSEVTEAVTSLECDAQQPVCMGVESLMHNAQHETQVLHCHSSVTVADSPRRVTIQPRIKRRWSSVDTSSLEPEVTKSIVKNALDERVQNSNLAFDKKPRSSKPPLRKVSKAKIDSNMCDKPRLGNVALSYGEIATHSAEPVALNVSPHMSPGSRHRQGVKTQAKPLSIEQARSLVILQDLLPKGTKEVSDKLKEFRGEALPSSAKFRSEALPSTKFRSEALPSAKFRGEVLTSTQSPCKKVKCQPQEASLGTGISNTDRKCLKELLMMLKKSVRPPSKPAASSSGPFANARAYESKYKASQLKKLHALEMRIQNKTLPGSRMTTADTDVVSAQPVTVETVGVDPFTTVTSVTMATHTMTTAAVTMATNPVVFTPMATEAIAAANVTMSTQSEASPVSPATSSGQGSAISHVSKDIAQREINKGSWSAESKQTKPSTTSSIGMTSSASTAVGMLGVTSSMVATAPQTTLVSSSTVCNARPTNTSCTRVSPRPVLVMPMTQPASSNASRNLSKRNRNDIYSDGDTFGSSRYIPIAPKPQGAFIQLPIQDNSAGQNQLYHRERKQGDSAKRAKVKVAKYLMGDMQTRAADFAPYKSVPMTTALCSADNVSVAKATPCPQEPVKYDTTAEPCPQESLKCDATTACSSDDQATGPDSYVQTNAHTLLVDTKCESPVKTTADGLVATLSTMATAIVSMSTVSVSMAATDPVKTVTRVTETMPAVFAGLTTNIQPATNKHNQNAGSISMVTQNNTMVTSTYAVPVTMTTQSLGPLCSVPKLTTKLVSSVGNVLQAPAVFSEAVTSIKACRTSLTESPTPPNDGFQTDTRKDDHKVSERSSLVLHGLVNADICPNFPQEDDSFSSVFSDNEAVIWSPGGAFCSPDTLTNIATTVIISDDSMDVISETNDGYIDLPFSRYIYASDTNISPSKCLKREMFSPSPGKAGDESLGFDLPQSSTPNHIHSNIKVDREDSVNAEHEVTDAPDNEATNDRNFEQVCQPTSESQVIGTLVVKQEIKVEQTSVLVKCNRKTSGVKGHATNDNKDLDILVHSAAVVARSKDKTECQTPFVNTTTTGKPNEASRKPSPTNTTVTGKIALECSKPNQMDTNVVNVAIKQDSKVVFLDDNQKPAKAYSHIKHRNLSSPCKKPAKEMSPDVFYTKNKRKIEEDSDVYSTNNVPKSCKKTLDFKAERNNPSSEAKRQKTRSSKSRDRDSKKSVTRGRHNSSM